MDYFLAVNDKQLGICLRMLYAEGLEVTVKTVRNSKSKIEFHVFINAEREDFARLQERYEILTS